jgi:uncharacterized membrane protein
MLAEMTLADISHSVLANVDISVPSVISRWVHIGSVIAIVGGTFLMRLVVHPAAREALADDAHQGLRTALMRRWGKWVHTLVLLIILSGIYNTIVWFPKHQGQPLYHSLWGLKVLLALGLFAIATMLTSSSPGLQKFREKAPRWMVINLVLAAIIVAISNILRSIPPSTGS